MSVNLTDFKKFAKIPQREQPAVKAIGVVTFHRLDESKDDLIIIPPGIKLSTKAQSYVTIENAEINQSQTFVPVLCQAKTGGVLGNTGRNQVWSVAMDRVRVTNELTMFSGGKDALQNFTGEDILYDWYIEDDSLLQSFLDLSIAKIKTRLAYKRDEELPDYPEVDRSVYLLANYYRENRSSQKAERSFRTETFDKKKISYFQGDRIFRAINQEITNLLGPYVRVSEFMPSVPGAINE